MTNTTPESKPQSVSPHLMDAERALRGQKFITAEATPEGLRLTGRLSLRGRTATLTEGDVIRAKTTRGLDGLRDHAMCALAKAPDSTSAEPAKLVESEERTESCPMHVEVDRDTNRVYFSLEALAEAVGLTAADDAGAGKSLKAGELHIDVTCDTGPAIASLEALEAVATHTAEKLDSGAGQLAVLLAVIPVVSGAVAAINPEFAPNAHELAAANLVNLLAKARNLAVGAE